VTVAGEEVALPWKETSPVKQRKEFVEACAVDGANMSELCRRFGVSRKTGYKCHHRYLGYSELEDRSRRPKVSPKAVSASLEARRRGNPPEKSFRPGALARES
jgi:transposase